MIIDHIAYCCKNRHKTAKLLMALFDYKIQAEFKIQFDDGSQADCIALEAIVKVENDDYLHHKPEFFVSDGAPGSIVDNWLNTKGIQSGIHHIALRVDDMQQACKDWLAAGGEFTTKEPLECPEEGLVQIFTSEVPEVGHVYEFIQRTGKGFCTSNVKRLMESSVEQPIQKTVGKKDPGMMKQLDEIYKERIRNRNANGDC